MHEVELKIVGIDRRKVEEKLESLDASKTFEGVVESMFFDFPDSSIARANNLLRLRRIGDRVELTFKKFIENENAKVREEYEVLVSDFEKMKQILESIGLVANQRMEKHRISYALKDGVKIDLDKYSGELSYIPDLMEVEAEDIATLHSHVRFLGFKPEDGKPWTTFELIDFYSKKSARN
jgi:predicted adenylyl cyclase CyaB